VCRTERYDPVVDRDELGSKLSDAVAAVQALASVLDAIARESSEPEIVALAEQALNSPTVLMVIEAQMVDAASAPETSAT
jgi:hypothetical protein